MGMIGEETINNISKRQNTHFLKYQSYLPQRRHLQKTLVQPIFLQCTFLIEQDKIDFKPLQNSAICNNLLMESLTKTKCSNSSFWNTVFRTKSYSYISSNCKDKFSSFTALQDFNIEISTTFQKKITSETLCAQAVQLVRKVYDNDPLGTGKMIAQFLSCDISKLRQRITQRLSLLKYVVDTLKYKPFSEVQRQILRQWEKNVIFFSINTIWATKMSVHKFTSLLEFTEEYKKQVSLIANLSHYYFKDALAILDGKNVATFCYLQEETAHKIINSLREWKDLYKDKLVALLKCKNLNQNTMMEMEYNPKLLQISENFIDLQSNQQNLVETINKIKQIASQPAIHVKIELLKEMRSTFIRQIEESRANISKYKRTNKYSTLEKDDIIGCMIYCIISGQITEIQTSLQAIYELLGPNNQFFSRKGVDSYRADLQSAVQYLCHQSQLNCPSKHKILQETMIRLQLTTNTSHLQLQVSK